MTDQDQGQPHFINPWKLFHGAFIPNWLLRQKGVGPGAKIVYGRLGQFAGRRGVADPRMVKLARECSMSVRQAQLYLRQLEAENLIHGTPGQAPTDPRQYRFLLHPWMGITPGASNYTTPVQEVTPPPVQILTPVSVKSCTGGAQVLAPGDSKEGIRFNSKNHPDAPRGPRRAAEAQNVARREAAGRRGLAGDDAAREDRLRDFRRRVEAMDPGARALLREDALVGVGESVLRAIGKKDHTQSETLLDLMGAELERRANQEGASK